MESLLLIESPSQSTQYAWSLQGYRPDTSEFLAALRAAKKPAFTQHNSLERELRWVALYCTDEDFSLSDLMRELSVSRETLHSVFAHHGVNYRRRNFVEGGVR